MGIKNTSDSIEEYIKTILAQALTNVGESLSQPVFSDILQLLFDEKIISQREGDLLLASASDAILGAEAPRIRARMLRKILQQLDRKGN